MKKTFALLLSTLAIASLVGCSPAEPKKTPAPTATVNPSVPASSPSAQTSPSTPATSAPLEATSTETVTIEHAMGTTEIPKKPQRVVILTNEGTEALIALEVKPVAAANSYIGEWYPHIAKDMEGVIGLGTESQINLEALAETKPDLIIANRMRHEKIYPQLSAIAPTVCSNTLRGEWKENFKFYSKILDKQEKGDALISKFDARSTEIATNNPEILPTEISLVRFMNGKTRIYLGDTFAGKILAQIGFNRPPSQQSKDEFMKEITKEQISEADGDVMFYYTYEPGDGAATAREEEWLKDPIFQSLECTKNGKVFKVNDTIWNTSGGILSANLMLDDIKNFISDGVFKLS